MEPALQAPAYLDDGRALLEPVRRHWPFIAIFVANLLAAITVFLAGKWAGETNRLDGCQAFDMGGQIGWVCPSPGEKLPPRMLAPDET